MSLITSPIPSDGRKARAKAASRHVDPLAEDRPADEQEPEAWSRRQRQRLQPGPEDLGIDAQRHDVHALGWDAGLEVAIADRPAIRPDLVDPAEHRQPGSGQAADTPKAASAPTGRLRRVEPRRPLVPHVHLRRPPSGRARRRQSRIERKPLGRDLVPAARPDQPQVMPPLEQRRQIARFTSRQRVQPLEIPLPGHAQSVLTFVRSTRSQISDMMETLERAKKLRAHESPCSHRAASVLLVLRPGGTRIIPSLICRCVCVLCPTIPL